MNNKYKIYVDMDGVLADFEGKFKEINSEHLYTAEYITKYGKNSFWKLIDSYNRQHFFESLNWMSGGKELWYFVTSNFSYVKILTSLGKSDRGDEHLTRDGKRGWLKKNLPDLRDEDIITVESRGRKKAYASPTSIIIDDTMSIIDDWRENNGIAIHHTNADKTIKELQKHTSFKLEYDIVP